MVATGIFDRNYTLNGLKAGYIYSFFVESRTIYGYSDRSTTL